MPHLFGRLVVLGCSWWSWRSLPTWIILWETLELKRLDISPLSEALRVEPAVGQQCRRAPLWPRRWPASSERLRPSLLQGWWPMGSAKRASGTQLGWGGPQGRTSAPRSGNFICSFMFILFPVSPQSGTTVTGIHFSQWIMKNLWQPAFFFSSPPCTESPLIPLCSCHNNPHRGLTSLSMR